MAKHNLAMLNDKHGYLLVAILSLNALANMAMQCSKFVHIFTLSSSDAADSSPPCTPASFTARFITALQASFTTPASSVCLLGDSSVPAIAWLTVRRFVDQCHVAQGEDLHMHM